MLGCLILASVQYIVLTAQMLFTDALKTECRTAADTGNSLPLTDIRVKLCSYPGIQHLVFILYGVDELKY